MKANRKTILAASALFAMLAVGGPAVAHETSSGASQAPESSGATHSEQDKYGFSPSQDRATARQGGAALHGHADRRGDGATLDGEQRHSEQDKYGYSPSENRAGPSR